MEPVPICNSESCSFYVNHNGPMWKDYEENDSKNDGGCVTCRSIVSPKSITSVAMDIYGMQSVLCPNCGSPTVILHLFNKDDGTPAHWPNWGTLLSYHKMVCAELHKSERLGTRALMYEWIDIDGPENMRVQVWTTIPDTTENASHMRNFIFETTKTPYDAPSTSPVAIRRSASEDTSQLRPQTFVYINRHEARLRVQLDR